MDIVIRDTSADLENASKGKNVVQPRKTTVFAICNRCKEKLQIKVDMGEMINNLKGGLFSVEVPHGRPNEPSHSTIFYLAVYADQIQVRGQVTADRRADLISLERDASESKAQDIQQEAPFGPESAQPQKQVRDITTGMLSVSIFIIGLGIALYANYDVPSSFLLASYTSLGITHGFRSLKQRKSTKHTKKTSYPLLQLESLEGTTLQDSEKGLLMLANKKTSRLLSFYQLLRGNSSELPLSVLNTVMSQSISLLYMNLGNRKGLLAVEHVVSGSKKQQGVWKIQKIPERIFETMKHHCIMVESGFEAGGIEFEKTINPPDLNWRLRLPPLPD
ncbi:MAG: hypothetical protein ACE5R6_01890 [Candidatus Heimdallarchaeota archaeon]